MRPHSGDASLGILDTLGRLRMRREPRRQRATFLIANPIEGGEHIVELPDVVAALAHVLESEHVGLAFVVAAVFQEEQLKAAAEQRPERRGFRKEDRSETQT